MSERLVEGSSTSRHCQDSLFSSGEYTEPTEIIDSPSVTTPHLHVLLVRALNGWPDITDTVVSLRERNLRDVVSKMGLWPMPSCCVQFQAEHYVACLNTLPGRFGQGDCLDCHELKVEPVVFMGPWRLCP